LGPPAQLFEAGGSYTLAPSVGRGRPQLMRPQGPCPSRHWAL